MRLSLFLFTLELKSVYHLLKSCLIKGEPIFVLFICVIFSIIIFDRISFFYQVLEELFTLENVFYSIFLNRNGLAEFE